MTKNYINDAFKTAKWSNLTPEEQGQLGEAFDEKIKFDPEAES